MPRLTHKPGVVLETILPALGEILAMLAHAAQRWQVDLVISCGNEAHPPTDPHTRGEALDLSIDGWSAAEIAARLGECRGALPADSFTVLFELPQAFAPDHPLAAVNRLATINPVATAPHFHLQVRKGVPYR